MRTTAAALAALLSLCPVVPRAAAIGPDVGIGIVLDGPWDENEAQLDLLRGEILALTEGEWQVRWQVRVADWTSPGLRGAVDDLLADPQVDLVIALGTLASHAVCCYGDLPKPVIAPLVLDAELQGFPRAGPGSGVHNLTYIAFPGQFSHEIEVFREVVPFDHLVILASRPLLDTIPALRLTTGTSLALGPGGPRVSRVEVGDSAESALAALPADTDAVYLAPLRHLPAAEYDRLIAGLIERRLPSFSLLGAREVARGVLAGLTPESFYQRLARRIALDVQRILLGEAPEDIPVAFPRRDRLTINMRTARAIGVSPRWTVLIEADQLHPLPEAVETLTFEGAVAEAVDANLDLEARRRGVYAAAYDVDAARAALLPSLDLGATALRIDEDRAAASLGGQSETSLSVGVEASQLLWSDAALAGLDIQRQLQRGREAELRQVRLDITLDAALAYLAVLRADTVAVVQRRNLELTRRNLELARVRRDVGATGAAEVHRWRSEVAVARKSLIEADARSRIARVALARLLHREQDRPLAYAPVAWNDPGLLTGQERFDAYVETPRRFDAFVAFMVAEALERAPELARVDAALAAQRRVLTAARRAFYLPTVALSARLDQLLDEGGAGSGSPGPLFAALPQADDTDWSLAVTARLPLFSGGRRTAERLQAAEQVAVLETERAALAERLEQLTRTALESAGGSYPGIDLSRQAAEAAQATLALVSDAYARGAVSILALLDAQGAALDAELLTANAEYDFLADLMRAQRSTDRFDFFLSPGERAAWFGRLEAWFAARGIDVAGPGAAATPPETDR